MSSGPKLTVTECFRCLAAHRGNAEFLANEQTGQVGVRIMVKEQNGVTHSWDWWFPTAPLDSSNGPLIASVRQVGEMYAGHLEAT